MSEQITFLESEIARRDEVLGWLRENMPRALAICPYKVQLGDYANSRDAPFPLGHMTDENVSDLFGQVVAEISERTGLSGPETMFSLASNFWSEQDLREEWPYGD